MIVRWGLDALPSVLAEVGSEEPLLVTTERWRGLDLPAANAFFGVESHGSPESVAEATAAAEGADGLLAVGGGSAIDTAKAVSAATGLPVVSVPTTYSGAEWTRGFGVRDEARRVKGGGVGAHVAGIVYEPELTYDLPPGESGVTGGLCGLLVVGKRVVVERGGGVLTDLLRPDHVLRLGVDGLLRRA